MVFGLGLWWCSLPLPFALHNLNTKTGCSRIDDSGKGHSHHQMVLLEIAGSDFLAPSPSSSRTEVHQVVTRQQPGEHYLRGLHCHRFELWSTSEDTADPLWCSFGPINVMPVATDTC